ncbi:signal peptidase I [uncultured Rikenella sp.]|uniref:signal peptidase I n=1 Tax=uncultured Rikenella sp. TaxID=368003 RepID=UPI002628CE53|nr:signal peptidase I [uncultured Rikenella sp.]
MDARCKKNILKWGMRAVVLLAVLFVMKYVLWIFVWDRYPVPTDSMYPTIVPGDRIMVDKLVFGARIYKSTDFLADTSEPPVFRMPGFRQLRRNDIVVFNFPNIGEQGIWFRINQVFVKRIVGLPGDTLSVERGFFRIAGLADTVGYLPAQRQIARMPDSVVAASPHRIYPWCVPQWTIRNFGPIYVPRRGTTVMLDSLTFPLYLPIMRRETGCEVVEAPAGAYLIDGRPATRYTFRDDYYFVAGDNGLSSFDSRYFGFLPEDYIVGVATRIWDSRDPHTGKMRWKRCMKSL